MNLLAHGTNKIGLLAILADNDKPTTIWSDSAFDPYTYLWDQAKLAEVDNLDEEDSERNLFYNAVSSGLVAAIGDMSQEIFIVVTDRETVGDELEDDTSDQNGNMIDSASRVSSVGFNSKIKKIYKYRVSLVDLVFSACCRVSMRKLPLNNFCGYIHEELELIAECMGNNEFNGYELCDRFDVDDLIDVTEEYL